jgi:hypothetical protein
VANIPYTQNVAILAPFKVAKAAKMASGQVKRAGSLP